jgi:DNA-binding CsgD family transcriptional regulator
VFRFASAFYERSPKFSWQLEGFLSQWSSWQTNPEKEFTNLPPGKYTFRVRTDLGGPEARVVFRIAPPWYLSRWAVGLYACIALALFLGIEHFNRYRLEKQRRRLMEEKQRDLARQRDEAEREKLLLEVENKNRELSNAALNLIRKNEVLQRLKDELVDANNEPRALQKIVRLINEHLEGDHDWEIFEESFNRVHDDFFKRLMHDFPDLTPGDLRLAAYLKMNLASKEIAPLLNISVRGVENKRYRLRKKLGLPEEANLTEFIMNF